MGAGVAISTSKNTIGGTTEGAANIISSNSGAGVALEQSKTAADNLISGNAIFGNGALGIDLDAGGTYSGIPLPNDSGIANNNGQNYPILTAVAVSAGGTTATGTFNSTPSETFTLEFFTNTTADPSGFGQGETYLTSTTVMTDATGNANFSVPLGGSVPIGSIISVTATDPNNNTSEFSHDLVALPMTTTSVTSAANPSVFGQSVTFTATVAAVAPGTGTPTGAVTFFDGATSLGSGTLQSPGVWTLSTATLGVGEHSSITADYSGDANFLSSNSANFAQVVNQASSTTTVTSSVNPSVFGQLVTFTATVMPVAPGAGEIEGSVGFFDGEQKLGAGKPVGPGVWTFTTAALAVGAHPDITAHFGGGPQFTASGSPNFLQTVGQASTTTLTISAPNPSTFGQSVTFTATVTAVAPGAGTPTGTVEFFDGTTLLGSGTPTTPGVWTLSTAALTAGSHPDITAQYSGDNNFLGSDSPSFSQTTGQSGSTTTVTSSPSPSVFGQSVAFTVIVAATLPGGGTGTGAVDFFDGASLLGAGTLTSPGVWTFSTSSLAPGSHPDITADYSGDANFQSSTSPAFSQTVGQSSSTTTVTASPSPSVSGQAVTFTVTVTATAPGAGTATGTVEFFDGATLLGNGTMTGPGVWTFSTSALTTGRTRISRPTTAAMPTSPAASRRASRKRLARRAACRFWHRRQTQVAYSKRQPSPPRSPPCRPGAAYRPASSLSLTARKCLARGRLLARVSGRLRPPPCR